ncbi:MAG: hypothetical protein LQ337_005281 [Flavoplaca oasis]|nr:MAG: hypothetical protein LQ337_005281 [Flavoplaca oasis]
MSIPTEVVGSLPRPQCKCSHNQSRLTRFADDENDRDQTYRKPMLSMPEPSIKTLWSPLRTRLPKIQSEEWPKQARHCFQTANNAFNPLRPTPSPTPLAPRASHFAIFDDGHHRQLPRLTSGPFKYKIYAYGSFKTGAPYAEGTGNAMKSAVMAPSLLYLLYPLNGNVEEYSKEQFVKDLVNECEKDIRRCFEAGAERVSIDFTEGRLASKKDSRDPWTDADLLKTFVDLNNKVLDRFSAEEKANIGIHACPGARFGEDKTTVYKQIGKSIRRDANGVKQVAFIGGTNPLNPKVETADEVAADILEASKYIA